MGILRWIKQRLLLDIWKMGKVDFVNLVAFLAIVQLTMGFTEAYVRKPDSRIPNVVQTQLFKDQVKSVQQIFKNNLDEKGPSQDQSHAHVFVSGNPYRDSEIKLNVQTHNKQYNLTLQRLHNSILHKDFKVLSISTDKNGKTLFHEDTRPHHIQEKAKQLHFYHSPQTGTLLSIKKAGELGPGTLLHHVEGIIHDELIIAPPTATKRHKRALHTETHTIWKKAQEVLNFEDDELFVPDYIDKLPFPKYYMQNQPPPPKTTQSSQGSAPNAHHRQKRQFRSEITKIEPELLLFCDNAMVSQFDGNTDELLEYLLHFWHAVNWKFLTISLQRKWPHIDLKIREIGVFRDANAQPFIEENRIRQGSRLFSLYDAMDSLQRWLVKYETVLPVHDVAFLQTGNDACRMSGQTRRFKDSRFTGDEDEEEIDGCVAGTAGVAYVRGACLSAPYFRKLAYNFGIGEASTSFNGIIIAAHEVGHLLGAYHDGEAEARGCASNSGYIMSYSREDAYKFSRFSLCSVRSFQNFLRMDRSGCLKRRGSVEIMQFPTSFPGTYMSINEQCRRFTGGPPCEIGPKQCEHLCCDDSKGQWRYTRSEPAVDGTACGTGQICLNGQCVALTSFG